MLPRATRPSASSPRASPDTAGGFNRLPMPTAVNKRDMADLDALVTPPL